MLEESICAPKYLQSVQYCLRTSPVSVNAVRYNVCYRSYLIQTFCLKNKENRPRTPYWYVSAHIVPSFLASISNYSCNSRTGIESQTNRECSQRKSLSKHIVANLSQNCHTFSTEQRGTLVNCVHAHT